MDHCDQLDERLAEISGLVLADESLDSVLGRIMAVITAQVGGFDYGGVTLVGERRMGTATVTDGRATVADDTQYRLGEGPCLQAIRDSSISRISDTATEPRFPRFAPEAAVLGVRSTLSLPFLVKGRAIGALNLYSERAGTFTDDHCRQGQYIADRVAVPLANAAFVDATTQLVTQLNQALTSRAVIEQAKGILMARENCPADEAFDVLRRASQHRNRKLRDLAEDLVKSTEWPTGGPAEQAEGR